MKTPIPLSRDRFRRTLKSGRQLGILLLGLTCFDVSAQTRASMRPLRPDDLFQVRRIGATAWSPDGRYATIEFSKLSRWLDGVPTNDISLLDTKTGSIRPLSPRSAGYIGFFNVIWSPDGHRVAFLSVDSKAVVRVWVWTVGTTAASHLPHIEPRIGQSDPPLAWIDGNRLAVMAWEVG